ncbi:MAG: AMP-binding protein, partial [Symbiobacteriaceae bacterium]|nr:AMP-binding protein [Symbiobacteriaceae bacterium]
MSNAPYPLYQVDPGTNLRQFVALWAEKYQEKNAFRFQDEGTAEITDISFQQFAQDVAALGSAFLELGLQRAKIAVVGDNSYDWIITYFAATNSNNIIVPLDRDLSATEVGYLLQRSDCQVVVHSQRYSSMLASMSAQLPHLQHTFLVGPGGSLRELLAHGHQLRAAGDTNFDQVDLDDTALAALLFTSGTTGVAKGVMLSHLNLSSDARISIMAVQLLHSTLLVLPLHHSFTFTTSVLCSLHSGATVAINKTLKDLADDLRLFKPRFLFLVPALVQALHKRVWQTMRKAGREAWLQQVVAHSDALVGLGVDLRKVIFRQVLESFGGDLDLIISGGAALDPSLVAKYHSFGIDLREGYGTTECSPVISVNRNNHFQVGSVGQPLPSLEVMIHAPDELGEGEICLKGDIVM